MNREVYELLTKLNEAELESYDYFDWTQERKDSIIEEILELFTPIIESDNQKAEQLLFSLILSIEKAEDYEEYEQAEILNRVYRGLLKKMGLEDIY